MQQQLAMLGQEPLLARDFHRFSSLFKRVVGEEMPGSDRLFFLTCAEDIPAQLASDEERRLTAAFMAQPAETRELFLVSGTSVFLTLSSAEGNILVLASGADSYFCQRLSPDWLVELAKGLENRFRQIKAAGMDISTGLLNRRLFSLSLDIAVSASSAALILVETSPAARSSHEAERQKIASAHSLESTFGRQAPLFYLGSQVFAAILCEVEQEAVLSAARRTLARLRQDGCRRVHVGICRSRQGQCGHNPVDGENLYDMAQYALRAATRRGPFAVCDHERISHPELHPLRKPSRRIESAFRRRWQGLDSFSIVQFEVAAGTIAPLRQAAGPVDIVEDGEDIYAFFPRRSAADALAAAREIAAAAGLSEVRLGAAAFPQDHFTRNQVARNCRKALRHAAFFGPEGQAVFDSLSLNISGDIFYAEGDLTAAVKEYRSGLLCRPDDVNLLNSLGVAYADMGRLREARACFERVLALEPENFMALYNGGLEAEMSGRDDEALRCFERAVDLETEFLEAKNDLTWRLGRLHCCAGNHARALELLLPWYEHNSDDPAGGKALGALGRACHGLGRHEEAAVWLQRALRYDEFDGESMVLLGHSYLCSGEGEEIALSLCRRGIELAPENIGLRLYLAEAEIASGTPERARRSLKACRRRKQTRVRAQFLTLLSYRAEKAWSRVRYWLKQLRSHPRLDDDIVRRLADIEEECNGL